jgi:thiosulfate reductase cytochrome b subunit
VTHWINALAVLIMVTSGWEVYDASPLFSNFTFPDVITLGGWLGGALQWHFAGMWLLVANGLVYLGCNIASGRLRYKFFPLSVRGIVQDLGAAIRGKLTHADLSHYNNVQRFAYLVVIVDTTLLLVSGLALWKPVQFAILRDLFGGYDATRYVHFCAMSILVAFVVVHLLMVLLVPRTLLAMIRGR